MHRWILQLKVNWARLQKSLVCKFSHIHFTFFYHSIWNYFLFLKKCCTDESLHLREQFVHFHPWYLGVHINGFHYLRLAVSVRGTSEFITKNILQRALMPSGKISTILCLYSHFHNRISEGLLAVLCEYGSIKFTEIPDARTSCVHPPRSLSTREVLKEIICLFTLFGPPRQDISHGTIAAAASSQWQERYTIFIF